MINDTTKEKFRGFRSSTRKWWQKRSDDQHSKVDSKRDRYIRILQKRYGFTKEKAISELDTNYSKTRLD
jgi:hypothetical protein